MRDRDGAELRHLLSKLDRAGQLRCHIRDAEKPLGSVIKVFERGKIRLFQVRAVLRALFLFGEERPLHLDAHDACAAGRLGVFELHGSLVRRLQHVIRQRHGRGREAGHAFLREVTRHFHKPVIVAVREIRAGVAVVMDVHKTRNDILVFQIDAVPRRDSVQHLRESAAFHAESAVLKTSVHENICVFKQHAYTSGRLAAAID